MKQIRYTEQLLIDMRKDPLRLAREKKEANQNAKAKLENLEFQKSRKNFYRSDT